MSTRKVIVTIAPTGGFLTPDVHPYVPTQPEEIAEDVRRCHDAGASMAALHARRPDHGATCDPRVYRRINELVRERCDIVVNNSTGGGAGGDMTRPGADGALVIDWAERLRGLDGGAETCTLDGLTAYAATPYGEVLMDTRPSRIRRLAELMRAKGIKPEWEVFSPANLVQEITELAPVLDDPPFLVNLVLGMHGTFQHAMPYTPRVLQQLVDLLPADAVFNATVCGPEQLRGLAHALVLGGHVRVGLEDTPYEPSGEPSRNVTQVERIVRIIRELGMEPATPAEARQILGLAPAPSSSKEARHVGTGH